LPKAIGVFTKLSLKRGPRPDPLAKLRESYDLLLLKVLSLLQDKGSGHRRIARSALESSGGSREVCKPVIPLGRTR